MMVTTSPSKRFKLEKHEKVESDCIVESVVEVYNFFKCDLKKTKLWFTTKNHQFGNIAPAKMFFIGRSERLLQSIKDLKDGNHE